jgi:hypothetical protein
MSRLLLCLLCASLGVNAYYVFQHTRGSTTSKSARPPAATAGRSSATPAFSADAWALIKSGDTSSPALLREFGFPEFAVRALARAELDARYAERENALRIAPAGYWQRDYAAWGGRRIKDQSAYLDLRREKEAELKRLLGPAYQPDNKQPNTYARFLPAEKAEELRLLEEDYQSMSADRGVTTRLRLPEDAERQRYLRQQRRSDIEALLTAEELAAYDMRTSSTASFLRYNLAGFDATEEEFKTLYALRKPLESLTSDHIIAGAPPTESSKARRDLEATVDAGIKATLGDKRYAEYKRSQDYDYRTFLGLTKRLDLPAEKAAAGYEVKRALEEKAKAFRPQPGTDAKQQRADFNATLLREAETSLTALYGEKGYAALRERITSRLQPTTR